MPKPDAYSPRRRILMQLIVWVIFGASLGIAAIAANHRAKALSSTATTPARIGRFSFGLPSSWQHEQPGPDESGDQLVVRQRTDPRYVRRLSVIAIDRRSIPAIPDYFSFSGPVSISNRQNIKIGSYEGMLQVATRSLGPEFDRVGQYDTEVVASVVVSGGEKLKIKLQRVPSYDLQDREDDIELVKQICGTVRIESQP